MARKRLGEILIEAGVIDDHKLKAALAEQRRWGGQLGKILIDMGVSEDAMIRALSAQLNFPIVDLDSIEVPQRVLEVISGDLAEKHGVIPVAMHGKFLDVAMADPMSLAIIDELRIKTQLNVRPHLAGAKAVERALSRLYGRGMEFSLAGDNRRSPPQANLRVFDEGGMRERQQRESQSGLTAGARRAQGLDALMAPSGDQQAIIDDLQARVAKLESLLARDEDVLRKLLAIVVERGLLTREDLMARLAESD
jgi:type IV pilus assembly protein PilB